jgi:hypothetical protein
MKHPLQFVVLLMLLLLLGCEQIIDIDLPKQDPVLVVNASFNPDSVWIVSVSQSQDIQRQGSAIPVTNAQVVILENSVAVDTLTHAVNDFYVSARGRSPKAGRGYTIKVSAPGFADVTGSDIVPVPVEPYNMTWRDSVSSDPFTGPLGEFSLTINDPAGTRNFYVLRIYRIDTFIELNDTFTYSNTVYPRIQDPVLDLDGYSGSVLLEDVTFDGGSRTIKVQIPSNDHDSTNLLFSFSTVTESYYRYSKTLNSYYDTGFNPFAEPVRIYSNMTPGMGIFCGFSMISGLVP